LKQNQNNKKLEGKRGRLFFPIKIYNKLNNIGKKEIGKKRASLIPFPFL